VGVLKESLEALKAVLLLQEEIKRLSENASKITGRLETLQERVIQLEAREQVIVARAEAAAQAASSHSRDREFGDLRERLLKIEMYLASNPSWQQVSILLTKESSRGDAKADG
jgi:predicted  nucleic acid-binding Zn-ribbon protein